LLRLGRTWWVPALAAVWVLAALRVASAASTTAGCGGVCTGGAAPGGACQDLGCPGTCVGGKTPGGSCWEPIECGGGCSLNPNVRCTGSVDCSIQGLGKCTAPGPGSCTAPVPGACIGQCHDREAEPDDVPGGAMALTGTSGLVIGNISVAG